MAEEPDFEFLENLVKGKDCIQTLPSDITVSVHRQDGGEEEYIFSEKISSDLIYSTTATNLATQFTPTHQEKFTEAVEDVKQSRSEEINFELGLPNIAFVKFGIKREPKKTIKIYKETTKRLTDNNCGKT